jgi:hypothetical protein
MVVLTMDLEGGVAGAEAGEVWTAPIGFQTIKSRAQCDRKRAPRHSR